MAKVCIICGNEIKGEGAYRVKEDIVIEWLRRIKKKFGIAKNNELFVCKDDYDKYKDKRKQFERNFMFASALAAAILLLLIIVPIFFGSLPSLSGIFFGLVVGVFLILMALLSYLPAVEGEKEGVEEKAKKKKRRE
ncbi:MAG: hypothetical protein ACPL06_03315 [Candidatus Anstonellales archaeon]